MSTPIGRPASAHPHPRRTSPWPTLVVGRPVRRADAATARVRRWAVLGTVAVLAMLLAVARSAVRARAAAHTAHAWVAHTERVLATVDRLELAVVDAETGQRGYLLTGQRAYLAPYGGARTRVADALRHLRDSTADNPSQRERLGRVAGLAAATLTAFDTTIALVAAGRRPTALATLGNGQAVRFMADLRYQLVAARMEERRLLAVRGARAERAASVVRAHVVVGAAFGGAVVLLVFGAVLRGALRLARTSAALDASHRALEASEAQLRAMVDHAALGITVVDPDGTLVRANAAFHAFLGHADGALVGRHAPDLSPPEDAAITRQPLADVRAGRAPSATVEKRFLRANGTMRWAELTLTRVPLADGRVGTLGMTVDATERRAQAAALERERAFLAGVLDALSENVSVCAPDGRPVLFNRAMRETHGLPAAGDLPPARWSAPDALYAPDGATPFPVAELPHVRVLATRQDVAGVEIVVRVPGRAPRTLVANAHPLLGAGGEFLGSVCAERDVTARKRAEAATRESEGRFRRVLESLSAFAVQLDAEGRVTFANDALLAATGWARDEVVGGDYFARFVPDGHEVRDVFAATVAAGRADELPAHYENVVLARDGARRLVAWDNVVLRDGDGRVAGTASVGRDVTEERRLAAERERLVRALGEQAEHDELTGLANRRGFRRMAAQERRGAARTARRDAVLYVDLDRFKPINDSHGHAAGDEALRAVARVLRETIRGADFAARLGGDEFAVYAVGITRPGEAPLLAARLHAALAAHNRAAHAAGRPFDIAFSVGVAEVDPDTSLEAALAQADVHLYAAKHTARYAARDRTLLAAG